ncbi:MAG: GntR family transcriptional regulator [Kiloniellales bacterium]
MAKRSTKETAHSRVAAALRDALMNGDLQPGQRLVVRAIAERFRTSPMPVREALRQLASDGALFDHPNRGVIVPEATLEVISDVVRVRCTIEGAATEWAASTISAEELQMLERLNAGMVASTAGGEAADYLTLNREFHFTIYRAARSATLVPVIERLWLRAGPWLNIMRGEATLGLGLDHHAEAVAALRAGNGAAARRAIVADIADAGDIMLRAASSGQARPAARRGAVPIEPAEQGS